MSEHHQSTEQLLEELNLLRREIAELKRDKTFFESHKKLLENLVVMTRYAKGQISLQATDNLLANWMAIAYSSEEESLLRESLHQALETSVNLTDADKGSLFLLNSNGTVTHSILTREETTPGERSQIIGKVLEQGLAGWVARHQQVGLITDTETDERWLTLPHQPYVARSALSVPIIQRGHLLAILTLLHSQPHHFTLATADLMEITATQIALVLEVAAHKIDQAAFEVQRNLLENLVEIARSPAQIGVLKSALQAMLDISTEQTNAEKGSLFVLDPSGKIADAILSRTEVTPEMRNQLVGSVLDAGLAGWVNQNHELGLVLDTETDERWLTLPDQPYVARSALCVPILKDNELLGIITLLHSKPNHFSRQVAKLMQVTADQMALILENARLYTKLDEYSKALNNELEKGRQIQIDFLPYEIPKLANWEISACFYPAKQVAGDFYDAFCIDQQVGLVLADVCDKGVGAALFMALFRSLIRIFSNQNTLRGLSSAILENAKPQEGWIGESGINLAHTNALHAVTLTNDYVCKHHWGLSMFATLFFGVLDPETGIMSYINGGHEPLFVLGKSGIKATLKPTGPAVGMMPHSKFKIKQIQFEPGDVLIGYTDGVTEGKNPEGHLFTKERLLALLEEPAMSANELIERIKTHLFQYIADAPQFDDITMIALHRQESSG
ncbi:MAG: GAF domain-containing SpoIIE family protein phosphatase [Snowella sp.]|nr:GAF domain-containing SpoIIE family protein phosphatase [Snowella sp.]